jgi:hypothetical protein
LVRGLFCCFCSSSASPRGCCSTASPDRAGCRARSPGETATLVTSALVGIAGSFVGYHLAVVLGILGLGALIVAIIGAVVVLWAWRTVR